MGAGFRFPVQITMRMVASNLRPYPKQQKRNLQFKRGTKTAYSCVQITRVANIFALKLMQHFSLLHLQSEYEYQGCEQV